MNIRTLAALVVLAIIGTGFALWSIEAGNTSGGESAPAAAPETGNLSETRENNQQQEAMAVATNMYLELQKEGVRTRGKLEELQRLHTKWTTEIAALPDSDEGRLIASDKESAEAFHAHFTNVKPLPPGELESMATRLSTLVAPIDATIASGEIAGVPRPELSTGLTELTGSIDEWTNSYTEAIASIESIARAAKSRGTRSAQTLQSELDRIEEEAALRRAAIIQEARAKAEDAVTEQLAMAEADRVRAEGEKKQQEMESEAQRLRATAEADAMKARATNPDTLKRLEPFITKGHSVLEANSRVYKWHKSETKKVSVSLKAISARRGLEDSEFGLECLQGIANDYRNGRPGWPQPSTPEEWDWVRENQKLLRELGTTLVELGYLEP
jgi:hypothetical protein